MMLSNLPAIDRNKLSQFLVTSRQLNGKRGNPGVWIPREEMTRSQRALDIFILDLISMIIDGEFDVIPNEE